MALIKCTECQHNVSDQAEKCPNCGYPVRKILSDLSFSYRQEQMKGLVCQECGCEQIAGIETPMGELVGICSKCGNKVTRQTMPEQYKTPINSTVVECPYCQSTNTKKISGSSRVASFLTFGLASKKVGKQWHCNKCGSDF